MWGLGWLGEPKSHQSAWVSTTHSQSLAVRIGKSELSILSKVQHMECILSHSLRWAVEWHLLFDDLCRWLWNISIYAILPPQLQVFLQMFSILHAILLWASETNCCMLQGPSARRWSQLNELTLESEIKKYMKMELGKFPRAAERSSLPGRGTNINFLIPLEGRLP